MAQTFFDDPRKLKIKDFVISDEFETIGSDKDIKDAIELLLSMNCGVLLVKEGEKEVKGVLTERKILKGMAEAKDPLNLKVKDIMDTHILTISFTEKLPKALELIEREKPAAVIVVDKDGGFKGYFSPMDFIQAEKMLKEARKRFGKEGVPFDEGDDEEGEAKKGDEEE